MIFAPPSKHFGDAAAGLSPTTIARLMMYAARRSDCEAARVRFAAEYQGKYPKAVESLTANCERLVSFFDFPTEHWSICAPLIESAFATVRLRAPPRAPARGPRGC